MGRGFITDPGFIRDAISGIAHILNHLISVVISVEGGYGTERLHSRLPDYPIFPTHIDMLLSFQFLLTGHMAEIS
jgi:hypothetical protein